MVKIKGVNEENKPVQEPAAGSRGDCDAQAARACMKPEKKPALCVKFKFVLRGRRTQCELMHNRAI